MGCLVTASSCSLGLLFTQLMTISFFISCGLLWVACQLCEWWVTRFCQPKRSFVLLPGHLEQQVERFSNWYRDNSLDLIQSLIHKVTLDFSVITLSFLCCFFCGWKVKSKNVLNKVVNVCGRVVGERQEHLSKLYEHRMVRKARVIVDDNSHVLAKY